jgi:hypothetical protein
MSECSWQLHRCILIERAERKFHFGNFPGCSLLYMEGARWIRDTRRSASYLALDCLPHDWATALD